MHSRASAAALVYPAINAFNFGILSGMALYFPDLRLQMGWMLALAAIVTLPAAWIAVPLVQRQFGTKRAPQMALVRSADRRSR